MICVSCSNKFTYVGQHYRQSDCKYPTLSDRQKKIVSGLLMSDASIPDDGEDRLRLEIEMKNKEFLEWLDNELSEFSTGVRESGKYYKLSTIRAPCFTELREKWYDNVKKFPDVSVTPLLMKMWYVGDGHLTKSDNRPMIAIGCSNEYSRQEMLTSLFKNVGVCPSYYSEAAWLSTDDTEQFLDYIGAPVAGFEYKWRNANE